MSKLIENVERRNATLDSLLREMTDGYRSRDHFIKYAPWTNDNDLRGRIADFASPKPTESGASE